MQASRTYTKARSRATTQRRPYTQRTTKKANFYKCDSPAFKPVRTECEWRMGSYRTVYSQFSGAAKQTVFSPTAANKWMKYVNSGYRVYKFSNLDFYKHFGNQWNYKSPAACQRWMKQNYGHGIKAITRGRANSWLVATTQYINKGPFKNYTWK